MDRGADEERNDSFGDSLRTLRNCCAGDVDVHLAGILGHLQCLTVAGPSPPQGEVPSHNGEPDGGVGRGDIASSR